MKNAMSDSAKYRPEVSVFKFYKDKSTMFDTNINANMLTET